MKSLFVVISIVLFLSCTSNKLESSSYKSNFSSTEQEIIDKAQKLIKDIYYTVLITIDDKGQPRARVMETFEPEDEFVIWMGTNPKSRKVNQINENSKTTLHFFDKSEVGYVSLMGHAYIVNDNAIKSRKWKKAWEQFYENQTDAYTLIKFVPESLEYIGILGGFTGDSITWAPHKVVLRE